MTELHRMAILKPPTTVDVEARSVELVVATEAVVRGLSLSCKPGAVSWGQVVPITLDHENRIRDVCGRLESLRFENNQLIGRAVFTDSPSAEIGWELARSGVACSVGASFPTGSVVSRADHDLVPKWRLDHVALVAQGADTNSFTRSFKNNMEPEITNSTTEEAQQLTRAQERRELAIRRYAVEARLSPEDTQRHVDSGKSLAEVTVEVLRAYAAKINPTRGGIVSYQAAGPVSPEEDMSLSSVLRAKMTGKESKLASVPLWRAVEMNLGDHPAFRGFDFNSATPMQVISRAWSIDDFSNFLVDASNRTVLDSYKTAPMGVRSLAKRQLVKDFRPLKQLRLSEVGGLEVKPEGGEYRMGTLSEELAATLQLSEMGTLVKLTRRAVANDDLDLWASLGSNLGRAAARAEGALIAQVLAAFSFTAANSASGAGVEAAVTAGAIDLRRQTGVAGEALNYTPTLLVCAPEQEALALKYLADFTPNNAAAVSPFRTMALEIDSQLASGTAYMVDTNYMPVTLGHLGDPIISQDEEFSTGSKYLRCQHDIGAVMTDSRSIVKLTIS